jgi:hypothetical protein
MVLLERSTVLPLDLVVLINSFLYERLTDEISNKQLIFGFRTKRNANFDSVTSATGRPQGSRIWREHFLIEEISMKTLAAGMWEG